MGMLLFAVALFLLGLLLSAFFSGNETGFYRLSFVRLNIDAHGGDRVSSRLLWFAQNPSYFVATSLVGNNVANYLTTAAIGLAVATVMEGGSGWLEIAATVLISPVIFVFGELVPKNLYFRAPMHLLRRDAKFFLWFYRLFLPISLPLIRVAKLFERFGHLPARQGALVLGRSRLVQVLNQGHQHGLLTDVQSRLIDGVMHTASRPVTESVTPAARILGLEESAPAEAILEYGRRYGLSGVPLKRKGSAADWFAYVRVADVRIAGKVSPQFVRRMPRIEAKQSKLQALLEMKHAQSMFGVVVGGERVRGLVSQRGLVEQLFRPARALAGAGR